MKKIYFLLIVPVAIIVINGCYDLDRFSEKEMSAGTFWKTLSHADQAMAGIYSMMQNDNVFGTAFAFDCMSDIATGYDPQSHNFVFLGTYNATTAKVLDKWRYLYEGVARANLVLQNIDNVSENEMSDDLKSQYKAEARFMRALYYFSLLDFFGGVPVYDETVIVAESFSEMKYPRSTDDKVREFIISDLDEAIARLPQEGEWGSTNYGRATKGSAQALKAKVLLYSKQYDAASKLFESVISSGLYDLYPDYVNLFKPGGDESNEMIFAIQNLGGVGQDYGMPMTFYMGSRSSYGSCWDNVTLATDFVDSYEYLDGKPFDWEDWIPGFTTDATIKDATFRATLASGNKTVETYPAALNLLLQIYDQRDPRMQQTIILPYTWYKGWVSNAQKDCEYVIATGVNEANGFIRVNNSWDIYLFRKFVAEYNMDGAINNRADTPINFPVIRYADVLLMLAECYNKLGKQTEAVGLINQVRARSNMPDINSGPSWLSANTESEVFERIKHERAVELVGEGHRYSDLKRWEQLELLNGKAEKGFTGKTYYTKVFSKRDYYWPIPQSEMDMNENLEQNPDW